MDSFDLNIPSFLGNAKKYNHRTMFVVSNNQVRQKIKTLYNLFSEKSGFLPDIAWCYCKNEERRRVRELAKSSKKMKINSENDSNKDQKKDLFENMENLRKYDLSELDKLLGTTQSFLVIQDTVTPNNLCKVMETVQGNGVIILVLGKENVTETEFFQYFSDKNEVEENNLIKSEGNSSVTHFDSSFYNKRLFKSFKKSKSILILNDSLKIINHPVQITDAKPVENVILRRDPLLRACKTDEQANALRTCLETLSEQERSLVYISAQRGRGKSALLGLSIAGAVTGANYNPYFYDDNVGENKDANQNADRELFLNSNPFRYVHIVAPFIENTKTLFDFTILGLSKLGLKEGRDFAIKRLKKQRSFVEEIVLFENRSNFIQKESQINGTTKANETPNANSRIKCSIKFFDVLTTPPTYPDLLVIDEAASLPLQKLKELLRPNKILLASTCDGYEGTGKSLQHKLLKNISVTKTLHLTDSIRYNVGDRIEKWLNKTVLVVSNSKKLTHMTIPENLKLFKINKMLLFKNEKLLQRIVSLFNESHYRNSPNDLKILSDEQNHEILILTDSDPFQIHEKKTETEQISTPENLNIYCAAHIAHESFSDTRCNTKEGNLIPWTLLDQFGFSDRSQSGIRFIRLAVHPEYQSMGYGTEMVNRMIKIMETKNDKTTQDLVQIKDITISDLKDIKTSENRILQDFQPKRHTYLGVSLSLNSRIFSFFSKLGFQPVHLSQVVNHKSGEFSCILVRKINRIETESESETSVATLPTKNNKNSLKIDPPQYFEHVNTIFTKKFLRLASVVWKSLGIELCMKISSSTLNNSPSDTKTDKHTVLRMDKFDFIRLQNFIGHKSDLPTIRDCLREIAFFYFTQPLSILPQAQEVILYAMGILGATQGEIIKETGSTRDNILILARKSVKKLIEAEIIVEE